MPSTATPGLVHRLTYNRANNQHLHVRGYKEEGTITTAFEHDGAHEMDRFHLAMDVLDRVPQLGNKGAYLKQHLKDKLVEHRQYITTTARICRGAEWRWPASSGTATRPK
ncbi:hypothetical protein [Hymenobacter sp. BRD128]|uniref:phosphoketolase family protein n=1 Tax=Hymenobacter sp. BRD128 TaxID=2675878 RepID=UPI00265DBDEB|nr:hypothetical protein [Hymenobacter sp. BRD128]